MHTYKDSTGKEWVISLSLGDAYELEQIDYSPITSSPPKFRSPEIETIQAILSDPILAGVIGWYFARKEVNTQQIKAQPSDPSYIPSPDTVTEGYRRPAQPLLSDKDYYARLKQPHIQALQNAIVQEYGDFFQIPPTSILKSIEKFSQLRKIGGEEIEKAMGEVTEEEMRKTIRERVAKAKQEMRTEEQLAQEEVAAAISGTLG